MSFRIKTESEPKAASLRNGDNDHQDALCMDMETTNEAVVSKDGQTCKKLDLHLPKCPKMEYQHAMLPHLELSLYVAVIGFVTFYVGWSTYHLSNENASRIGSLSRGWAIFGHREKDETNYQWSLFMAAISMPAAILSYIVYIFLGHLVIFAAPQFRKHFMLMYSVLWIYLGFGWNVLAVLFLHASAVYLVSITRSRILVWIAALFAIASVYVDSVSKVQAMYFGSTFNGSVCIATSTLRLLCYGLEVCQNTQPNRPATSRNYFDLLVYNFYIPVFPYGPFIGYNTFLDQVNSKVKVLSREEMQYICKELMRCLFWAIFTEACIHFFNFGGMTANKKTRLSLTSRELSMLAVQHLFFFQLTTMVPYSLSRVLALCDHVQAPSPPICILTIHYFKDMWKYFDRGLNTFLKTYVYIPLGGSRHGLLRQSIAALMCFVFAAFWHGGRQTFYIWALLNWIGIHLESIVLALSEHYGLLQTLQDRLSGPMLRRFYTACAVPNYLFLAFANLVFVIGPSNTKYFAYMILFNDWPWNTVWIFTAFYCAVQIVNEAERVIGKRKLLSKNYI